MGSDLRRKVEDLLSGACGELVKQCKQMVCRPVHRVQDPGRKQACGYAPININDSISSQRLDVAENETESLAVGLSVHALSRTVPRHSKVVPARPAITAPKNRNTPMR